MTQERFLKIMENPDLLSSISYEELKTLALAYPYVTNLRYLLALKSKQENHPEFSRNLALASTYSIDRQRLYQILAPKQLAPQRILVEKEAPPVVLELKSIETVQKELQSRTAIPVHVEIKENNRREESMPIPAPENAQDNRNKSNKEEVVYDFSGIMRKNQDNKPPAPVVFGQDFPQSEKTKSAVEWLLDNPQKSASVKPVISRPLFEDDEKTVTTSKFDDWMGKFKPPVLGENRPNRLQSLMGNVKMPSLVAEKTTPAPSLQTTVNTMAERSVTESSELVSETLAKLYVRQGYISKAISMYERLCLAFPEKSLSFAAEIEKLKNS